MGRKMQLFLGRSPCVHRTKAAEQGKINKEEGGRWPHETDNTGRYRKGAQVQFVSHSASGKDQESVQARFALIAAARNGKIEL
jgi:hypothetical protein